jgi:hypothetical protein
VTLCVRSLHTSETLGAVVRSSSPRRHRLPVDRDGGECYGSRTPRRRPNPEDDLKRDELKKVESYLQRKFSLPSISVRARPKKDDSAEFYIGDEFVGIIFRDDEDGELSWNLQIAILEMDLED